MIARLEGMELKRQAYKEIREAYRGRKKSCEGICSHELLVVQLIIVVLPHVVGSETSL